MSSDRPVAPDEAEGSSEATAEAIRNAMSFVQKVLPISPDETLHSLYLKTTAVGPAVLAEAIDKLEAGAAERIANDASRATYFSFPTREQSRQFRRRGGRFF